MHGISAFEVYIVLLIKIKKSYITIVKKYYLGLFWQESSLTNFSFTNQQ